MHGYFLQAAKTHVCRSANEVIGRKERPKAA